MVQRVGLLTLPLHTNYGGMLQAAALYHILSVDMGRDVVFLERNKAVRPWSGRMLTIRALSFTPGIALVQCVLAKVAGRLPPAFAKKVTDKVDFAVRTWRIRSHAVFLNRFLPKRTGPLTSSQAMTDAVCRLGIDAVVVGSDQVWRFEYLPDEQAKADFFLGFVPNPEVRKISYAASFGHGNWTYPALTDQTKVLLARFDAISVRETSGVAICADVLGRDDARHVIDPTLLVDPSFYDSIAKATVRKPHKVLLTYVMDRQSNDADIVGQVQSMLGSDYAIRPLRLDEGLSTLSVSKWVRGFMDADFVITDSFHGTVFAIIFGKNFISIVNHGRGADRFTSLLGPLGLEDRLVSCAALEQLGDLACQAIDFAAVNAKLAPLRAASLAFLRSAIDSDEHQSA